ncbi:glycosyltransferase family protein [Actinobacillus delphinicola]|uniref:Uncharacterized protein n=1 Tax=Actinobacillus delphinicola TaxID=51161 RepID=A0A448TV78_9PAST|nr:hypothetical protein [Actinobacillus delphinicola]VEJ09832.1 Uncharacterised protein [Actinobacillus delphinicola]
MEKIDILFVCYGGGHSAIIKPLAEELIKNHPKINFKILALTLAHNSMKKKFPHHTLGLKDIIKIFSVQEKQEITKLGKSILSENYRDDGTVSEYESILYLGLSLYDLIHARGKEEAYKQYNNFHRAAFLPKITMERILKNLKPRLVCATNAPRFEKAALLAANNLNIENYEIIDLFGENHEVSSRNIIVMDEYVIHNLKLNNKKNIKYFSLGQPAVENTVKEIKSLDRRLITDKLHLFKYNRSAINIVFFSQRISFINKELTLKFYNKLLKVFNNLSSLYNINIFVRLHPGENIEDYWGKLDCSNLKFIHDILTLPESIVLGDIIVTQYSTVALESIYSGKTVCTFHHNLEGTYPVSRFMMDPYLFSMGFDELEDNLISLLDNPSILLRKITKSTNSVHKIIQLFINSLCRENSICD